MTPKFSINNFDAIRLFAASQVMVQHAFSYLQIPVPFWLSIFYKFQGVPIFFVISGYLISSSLERCQGYSHYLTNRFLRIFPGLWACITLTLISASIAGNIDFFNKQTPVWLASQMVGLIYTPHFLTGYGFGSYNGSLWTIPIELQFYIVLPIVYILLIGIERKATAIVSLLLAFIAIAVVLKILLPGMGMQGESPMEKLVRYSFVPHFYLFLAGVVLQRLKAYQWEIVYGKGVHWVGVYLIFVYFAPDFPIKFLISNLLLAMSVISLAYTVPSASKRIFNGTDISYGVYIYHGIIINILVEYRQFGNLVYLFALFAATYSIALMSWNYIEKPMLRKKVVASAHQ